MYLKLLGTLWQLRTRICGDKEKRDGKEKG
jgi:hypothetical protein